jgi:cytochrome c
MKLAKFAVAALCLSASAAFAEGHAMAPSGDAEAGAEVFNRQCVACHVVVDAEGNTLAGRNARTGPNLYGVAMRQAGIVEDFRYGDSIVEAGEAGLVWDEESFVAYAQDPNGFLREYLDDRRARGRMAFQLRDADDAADVYAYLVSIGPELMMDEAAGEAEEAPAE